MPRPFPWAKFDTLWAIHPERQPPIPVENRPRVDTRPAIDANPMMPAVMSAFERGEQKLQRTSSQVVSKSCFIIVMISNSTDCYSIKNGHRFLF